MNFGDQYELHNAKRRVIEVSGKKVYVKINNSTVKHSVSHEGQPPGECSTSAG